MTSIPFLVIIMMALLLVYCIESYTVNSWKSSISGIGSCKKHRLQAKPDLFADDLFDDNDSLKPTKKEENNKDETNKRKYLDQKWKLNAEDAKDFKGFPKNDAIAASTATVNPVDAANSPIPQVPVFALMYKFRKEYLDTTVESMMADHKGHCSKFKRLLSSEFINIGKAKGVVSLWAGFTEVDKAETKADIMSFLEEDPLIVKDVVENWDIIDFTQGSEKDLKVVAA